MKSSTPVLAPLSKLPHHDNGRNLCPNSCYLAFLHQNFQLHFPNCGYVTLNGGQACCSKSVSSELAEFVDSTHRPSIAAVDKEESRMHFAHQLSE
ncbi:hypothetical protein TNCV_2151851 [Trichonephila clavipes]|uniref:Uncharacterized protein n=1 Tax=Trichonephila clavipes TaxID=2585209 RepID=A0A8X6RCJ5_TRICX|nr:hypothetical protein TNCV_2151851 [Trichonephila clavipes]